MSWKQIFIVFTGISSIPLIITHFNINVKNKDELINSIDHLKKGSAGIIRFSYGFFKDFLENNK